VAGLGVRVFTDEMIDPDLAVAARQNGYDIESCREAHRNNQKIPDEDQLDYAARQGRAILTFNVGDFYERDAAVRPPSGAPRGIIVSAEITDLGVLLRRMQCHLDAHAPADQHNTILWLEPDPGP
jgi:hypothetical protein